MSDSVTEQVQAILDDCSDELNPMYEPANLKHEIEAALRKATNQVFAVTNTVSFEIGTSRLRAVRTPEVRVFRHAPSPNENEDRKAIASVQLLEKDSKIILCYWREGMKVELYIPLVDL